VRKKGGSGRGFTGKWERNEEVRGKKGARGEYLNN